MLPSMLGDLLTDEKETVKRRVAPDAYCELHEHVSNNKVFRKKRDKITFIHIGWVKCLHFIFRCSS